MKLSKAVAIMKQTMYNITKIITNERRDCTMPNIKQVAKYILQKKGTLSTLKLQKLCYYCQAWHLAWEDVPLFDEDFEAWANGPVCPTLFQCHKGKFSISADEINVTLDDNTFTNVQKTDIDNVLQFYGDKESHWLSELTHQERPWKETREAAGARPGDVCTKIISKDIMQDYYAGL